MSRRPWFVAPALGALFLVAPLAAQASPTAPSTAPAAAKAAPAKAAPAQAAPARPSPAQPAALVDLNSASREELVKLPGIGEAIAAKIVAGRPFKAKSDLLARGLVNRDQYAKLAPRVIAKQAPPEASKE